jgi:hypothetical protein
MQIFKSLRIGATFNPVIFLLGVYNFAAGVRCSPLSASCMT